MTELRLRADVLISTNDGLVSENSHLSTELKQIKKVNQAYDDKN